MTIPSDGSNTLPLRGKLLVKAPVKTTAAGSSAAGNTLTYSNVTATYNNRGRMKSLTKASVTANDVYDALGHLVRQSGGPSGTVIYVYDEANHLIGEYNGSGTVIQETVWLGDIPVATIRPNGSGGYAHFYVHSNQLNAPFRVTRPSDNKLMWTWYADPFGTSLPNENPASGGTFKYNLRFPGQIYDSHAGLSQNYFRDYDAAIGRYAQSDPLGLYAGSTSTYSYVDGNPIQLVDVLGLCWVYSQSTGRLTHRRGSVFGVGYAGFGLGVNNPAMEGTPNIGPLPQGEYVIGKQQDIVTQDGRHLKQAMRLTPKAATNMHGRSGFLIHGPRANDQQNSSNGCPILTRDTRDFIGNSNDKCLRVIP